MKEQGAGRACKDDWAQVVGNDLLPETLGHPEGLSGSKVPRMACLWLMGRAMTCATMKIAPFLPKRSKTMRPRRQTSKSIKKLTQTIKRATQTSKIWFFQKKNQPRGKILKI